MCDYKFLVRWRVISIKEGCRNIHEFSKQSTIKTSMYERTEKLNQEDFRAYRISFTYMTENTKTITSSFSFRQWHGNDHSFLNNYK